MIFDNEKLDSILKEFDRLPNYKKRHFDKWSMILMRADECRGTNALNDFVKKWNVLYPDKKTSVSSIYRNRKIVKEKTRMGLLEKKFKVNRSTVKEMWFEDYSYSRFINKQKAEQARNYALNKAIARKEVFSRFPSKDAFRRKIRRINFDSPEGKMWMDKYIKNV